MTSPLSFMIGLRPTGLTEFVDAARPAGLYGLNNCPVYPGVQNVLRVQDNTWGRLPDACGVDRYFESQDPIASAEYELIGKTQYIPNRGYLTLIEKWKLDQAAWYAPYNEWALDQGPDSYLKADWMNAWTCRALEIAHGFNLKLCIGSFATGNPSFELLPRLYPMLRLAKIYGGILDLHEYGVEGALMSSPSSGALRYRELYAALPAECRIPIVISEFWWGNGFEQANVAAQIEDARQYGLELARDKYLLWAAAFQLDEKAENNFTLAAVADYAEAAASVQKQTNGGTSMTSVFGVHCTSSPGPMRAGDAAGISAAQKFNGYKFLTGDPPEHYQQVKTLGLLPMNCLTRLFMDVGERPKPTPEQFCNEQGLAIVEAMAAGVTWFEVHNEPNLTNEWPWATDPHDFAAWYLQVVALLRSQHPGIKIISPGLSPQPNTPQWWIDFGAHGVFDVSDAIGAHVYWPNRATMLTQAQGLNFIPLVPMSSATKPIYITEYCNNVGSDADYDKGKQYVEWWNYILANYPTVTRAYLYIISSTTPAENDTRQTIVRGGVVSQIATGIREAGTTPPPVDEYVFDHWHVNGSDGGTSPTLTLTLDAPKTVTAVYRKKVTLYTFQLSTDPPGLTNRVTQTPAGSELPAGTQITVTAT